MSTVCQVHQQTDICETIKFMQIILKALVSCVFHKQVLNVNFQLFNVCIIIILRILKITELTEYERGLCSINYTNIIYAIMKFLQLRNSLSEYDIKQRNEGEKIFRSEKFLEPSCFLDCNSFLTRI